jgi:hypothetical protein
VVIEQSEEAMTAPAAHGAYHLETCRETADSSTVITVEAV